MYIVLINYFQNHFDDDNEYETESLMSFIILNEEDDYKKLYDQVYKFFRKTFPRISLASNGKMTLSIYQTNFDIITFHNKPIFRFEFNSIPEYVINYNELTDSYEKFLNDLTSDRKMIEINKKINNFTKIVMNHLKQTFFKDMFEMKRLNKQLGTQKGLPEEFEFKQNLTFNGFFGKTSRRKTSKKTFRRKTSKKTFRRKTFEKNFSKKDFRKKLDDIN